MAVRIVTLNGERYVNPWVVREMWKAEENGIYSDTPVYLIRGTDNFELKFKTRSERDAALLKLLKFTGYEEEAVVELPRIVETPKPVAKPSPVKKKAVNGR